jgi:hypothetical protein
MVYFPLCQEGGNCNASGRVFDEKLRRGELVTEMLLRTEHGQSVETTNGYNAFLKEISDEFIEFRVARFDLHCFEWVVYVTKVMKVFTVGTQRF